MNTKSAPKIFDYRDVDKADEFEDIPVLDMGPYLAGEPGAAEELAANIRFIQETIGFYVVINHGLDSKLVDDAYAALQDFFLLSSEEKAAYKFDETSVGYIAPKSTVYVTSKINKNTKQDLNETLVLALERPDDHPYVRDGVRFTGPNKWPDIDGFRAPMVRYQNACADLGRKMVPLYALALDKPADFFDKYFEEPIMWTRNAHYPAVEPEENQFGISPHSDHSFLTILPLTKVGGLQVLTRQGNWLPAAYIEDALVINTGEFLNLWSNGRFIASPHRVIPPAEDRISMATFFDAAPETIADPADFAEPGEELKYEPISQIDYVSWYIDRNYSSKAGGKAEGIDPDAA
ncbi:MAG: 2-oxoglutarate and iron-dependent oxygenase domain-containing protein [Alphaproteobacteria bacterium]